MQKQICSKRHNAFSKIKRYVGYFFVLVSIVFLTVSCKKKKDFKVDPTYYSYINLEDSTFLFFPNAFIADTMRIDKNNCLFFPIGVGYKNLNCTIKNNLGSTVYKGDNLTTGTPAYKTESGWNGVKKNGKYYNHGVYKVTFSFETASGNKVEDQIFIFLIEDICYINYEVRDKLVFPDMIDPIWGKIFPTNTFLIPCI